MSLEWYWNAAIVVGTFWVMEWVAWATHKYVMHGFLWNLHYDHHNKQKGFFEKNDAFFLIFAVPSWLCIMLGMMHQVGPAVYIGYGIAVYGFAYFLVHEVFIHRRFKWFGTGSHTYLRAVLLAHKMHHSHLGKEQGESFGMLIVHPRYWKMARRQQGKRRGTRVQASA
jgi:beta-carotene 3-hydroxylase